MKSVKVKKESKNYHFYDEFGKYQWGKVSVVVVKLILLTIVYQYLFLKNIDWIEGVLK